jgi:hypothetical protein
MLVIRIRTANKHLDVQWHIGNPIPLNFHEYNDIIDIQADGDELNAIVSAFSWTERGHTIMTIPYNPLKQVQRWFGDVAKSIVWGIN